MLLHSNCSNLQIRAVPSLLPLKNLKTYIRDLTLIYMPPTATVKIKAKINFNMVILTTDESIGVKSQKTKLN